jgi:small subunit ribosomal protein S11
MAEDIEKQATEAAPEAKATEATTPAESTPKADTAPAAAAPKAEKTAPAAAAPKAEKAAPKAAAPSVAEEAPVQTAADVLSETDAPAVDALAADAGPKRRGRFAKHIPVGIAHIKATFNNTQVAITDPRGGVVSWSSAGRAGFKGSRKSTAFAATLVAQEAARGAVAKGMHEVEVRVQGAGAGRESAIRGIQSAGMSVSMIKDVTPIAHNGCRARKRRRV